MGYSFNKFLLRGFERFENLIKNETFNILLIRPENNYLQIMGSNIPFSNLGRVIQSFIVFIVSLFMMKTKWNILKVLTTIFMIMGSFAIFAGIIIMGAALCFFTIEGLEFRNVFTDGGRETAQYPINIYPKEFRLFFTFIIPYALVNYYPLLYVIGKTNNIFFVFLPLLAVLFIIPAILIFNFCVKKYKSSGS